MIIMRMRGSLLYPKLHKSIYIYIVFIISDFNSLVKSLNTEILHKNSVAVLC